MRISRTKVPTSDIALPPEGVETSLAARRRKLAGQIQAALKVGADLPAREAGRRAFSEFMKLLPELQPAPQLALASPAQVMFTAPKRKRPVI